jgi:hypothetical protein
MSTRSGTRSPSIRARAVQIGALLLLAWSAACAVSTEPEGETQSDLTLDTQPVDAATSAVSQATSDEDASDADAGPQEAGNDEGPSTSTSSPSGGGSGSSSGSADGDGSSGSNAGSEDIDSFGWGSGWSSGSSSGSSSYGGGSSSSGVSTSTSGNSSDTSGGTSTSWTNPSDVFGRGAGSVSDTVKVCPDTEMTDQYVDGVNLRTRCVLTEIPIGSVELGSLLSLPVTMVYNEARPPPDELVYGTPSTTFSYGAGGWASTDKIFTDEGVYWTNTGKLSMPLKGSRSDLNKNGYIGYTLHTPYGSRTYDYPVVLTVKGKKVGAYRSEPFDGQFLMVKARNPDDRLSAQVYTLFQYPNGPFEIYEWSLATPAAITTKLPDIVLDASFLSSIEAYFGPRSIGPKAGFEPKVLRISRARWNINYRDGSKSMTNDTAGVLAAVDVTRGWEVTFAPPEAQKDLGLKNTITRLPGKLTYTALMTKNAGYHVETLTRPGRLNDDLLTFEWNQAQIKTIDAKVRDQKSATTFEDKLTYVRAKDGLTVHHVTHTLTFQGVALGDQTTLFEPCDVGGNAFSGTTVSLPRNVRMTFEYGDDTVLHRLLAQTDQASVRTQYQYNDLKTEPRGELTDMVQVPKAGADLTAGYGTHVDWDMITQADIDPALFPKDTFVNKPAASKGVPVPKQFVRRPDGLVLRAMSSYDTSVLLPKTIADERGSKHTLTYYSDTGDVNTHAYRGITTTYERSFESNIRSARYLGYTFFTIESKLSAGGKTVSLGKTSWDHAGRFFRNVKFGDKLDPSSPTSGAFKSTTVEKRFERGDFMTPTQLMTLIDDSVVSKTTTTWDPRLMGPASTSWNAGSDGLGSAQGGSVDGLGSPTGNWQISGLGDNLAMVTQLDPLGRVQAASANGVGVKLSYAAGPQAGTLKQTTSQLAGSNEIPDTDEVQSKGSTDPVCK